MLFIMGILFSHLNNPLKIELPIFLPNVFMAELVTLSAAFSAFDFFFLVDDFFSNFCFSFS